ncbi:hypothetical protein ABH897_004673 [Paenibacillus sp. RC73]|uniref:hypothetical protein n=1 Tax=Paenibacillus sp. RC73 TaxID=3156250 RepID=UPI0038335E41
MNTRTLSEIDGNSGGKVMTRMSHAIFNKQTDNLVCALDVDSEYYKYQDKRDKFSCKFCGVQVQFTRGKDHKDPHFKNWPLINHLSECAIPNIEKQKEKFENYGEIEQLVSTILPRSQRLKDDKTTININRVNRAKEFGGRRSRKFIYSLVNLLDSRNYFNLKKDYEELELLIEDGNIIKLRELMGSQDEIIQRIDATNGEGLICILRGNTRKAKTIKNNIVIPLTRGNNPAYKNTKDFSLFIRWDYVEKNKEFIESIENALVICYGEAKTNQYGTELEIFSIKSQIVVLKKYDN